MPLRVVGRSWPRRRPRVGLWFWDVDCDEVVVTGWWAAWEAERCVAQLS